MSSQDSRSTENPTSPGTRRNRAGIRAWAAFVVSLLGMGVSIYLTIAHYDTKVVLACADNSVINCTKVTTSSYSVLLGFPVAVLGLAFFVVMVILNVPKWFSTASREIQRFRLALSAVGVLMVFYLLYAELFGVGAICLWCTSVHILTVILYGIVVTSYARLPKREPYNPGSHR